MAIAYGSYLSRAACWSWLSIDPWGDPVESGAFADFNTLTLIFMYVSVAIPRDR